MARNPASVESVNVVVNLAREAFGNVVCSHLEGLVDRETHETDLVLRLTIDASELTFAQMSDRDGKFMASLVELPADERGDFSVSIHPINAKDGWRSGDFAQTQEASCHDCGLDMEDPGWADLVVPHEVWNTKLSPTGDEGGLLCPTCMVRAAALAGVECKAVFSSGPFADVDRYLSLNADPVFGDAGDEVVSGGSAGSPESVAPGTALYDYLTSTPPSRRMYSMAPTAYLDLEHDCLIYTDDPDPDLVPVWFHRPPPHMGGEKP